MMMQATFATTVLIILVGIIGLSIPFGLYFISKKLHQLLVHSRKKQMLFFFAFLLLFIAIFFACSDFVVIDSCLDSGGAWDYQTKTCKYS